MFLNWYNQLFLFMFYFISLILYALLLSAFEQGFGESALQVLYILYILYLQCGAVELGWCIEFKYWLHSVAKIV